VSHADRGWKLWHCGWTGIRLFWKCWCGRPFCQVSILPYQCLILVSAFRFLVVSFAIFVPHLPSSLSVLNCGCHFGFITVLVDKCNWCSRNWSLDTLKTLMLWLKSRWWTFFREALALIDLKENAYGLWNHGCFLLFLNFFFCFNKMCFFRCVAVMHRLSLIWRMCFFT